MDYRKPLSYIGSMLQSISTLKAVIYFYFFYFVIITVYLNTLLYLVYVGRRTSTQFSSVPRENSQVSRTVCIYIITVFNFHNIAFIFSASTRSLFTPYKRFLRFQCDVALPARPHTKQQRGKINNLLYCMYTKSMYQRALMKCKIVIFSIFNMKNPTLLLCYFGRCR